ncbi:MAG TPA: hypothetical protein PKE06_10435 [Flavilitoribacter sp.]|mgnify:CR=1 FL=1|nr:hypothetical protein [Flavilitoribacter sp.]HMQ86281.1 hypothetical protein [Flavilitoribacter sp.]
MKKLLLFCLPVLLMAGCAREKGPEAIAEAFIKATIKGDYQKGASYCVPESRELYMTLIPMAAERLKNARYKNVVCRTDEAAGLSECDVVIVNGGVEQNDGDVKLELREGSWMVVFSKDK